MRPLSLNHSLRKSAGLFEVRILVTGAGGLLGADLCRSLDAAGFEVVATGRRANSGIDGIKTLIADLTDTLDVEKLFVGKPYDAVIHCAAVIKERGSKDQYLDNVKATENLAVCARQFGVSKFIFMSTISVYEGNGPFSETSPLISSGGYAVSKVAGEHILQLLASDDFKVIALRLAGLHGARRQGGVVRSLIDAAALDQTLSVPEPGSTISLTFLEDARSAISELLILSWPLPWSVYNFANPAPLPLAELANLVTYRMKTNSTVDLGGRSPRNRHLLVEKLQLDYGILLMPTEERMKAIIADSKRLDKS
jgi:nucleoside-diphosphate-sugar epimerase